MIKKKAWIIGLFFILLLVAASFKLYVQKASAVVSTGTIEVTTADIMAKRSGYLAELSIREGNNVSAGQRVAKLDRADLDAQLARDTAALAKARAQLADLERGARPEELREAAANAASASSVAEHARKDYTRYRQLFDSGAISKQQLDEAKSNDEVALSALLAAKEKENLLLAGSRGDLIDAQRAEVDRSEAVLRATQIAADESLIHSPLTGLVLRKNFEPGEYVSVGSAIATIADTRDCWVKIYVPSTELGLIKTGQAAKVKIDAFPDRIFAGMIKEISDNAEFTPRQSITRKERANLVFAVKISVENNEGILKPGLPADVILSD